VTGHQKSIQQRILPRIQELSIERYGENLIGLVVYGSVARETEHCQSDIDVLVVLNQVPKVRFERMDFFIDEIETPILKEFTSHESCFQIEINPNIKSFEELMAGSFLNFTIASEGIILFEKDHIISGYFTKLRNRFKEMGVQKIPYAGGFYYDFLPNAKSLEVFDL